MKKNSVRKANFLFRLFTFYKIPLIFYCGAKIIELDEIKTVIKIPLNFRTKNHLNSMYFGVLAVGADIAGGLAAMDIIRNKKVKVSLVFKDMNAEFLRRAETDVYFVCNDGEKVFKLIEKSLNTGLREEEKINVIAYSNYNVSTEESNPEIVARFDLTLSLKKK